MAARMAKGMDPLGALPSGSDSDADSDDAVPSEAAAKTAPANPTEAKIDYEALRKHGMKTAPTLEGIKDAGGGEGAWGGREARRRRSRYDDRGGFTRRRTRLERACASPSRRPRRNETRAPRTGATRGGGGDATGASGKRASAT